MLGYYNGKENNCVLSKDCNLLIILECNKSVYSGYILTDDHKFGVRYHVAINFICIYKLYKPHFLHKFYTV